jgi:hypothetical protein
VEDIGRPSIASGILSVRFPGLQDFNREPCDVSIDLVGVVLAKPYSVGGRTFLLGGKTPVIAGTS